ncbi:hypothetical protein BES34_017020 [Leptospira inadai serovar Lyme]|uniref:Uncharacterized protein n=1 Tax=Leptospira inadai serovar Lyme TaxID=293084 RepID=A0ABX4YEZ3_9LEPT|nr:hypothetical protein BES34_017020 [Leptospira inadai serovar Lyme]
MNSNRIVWNLRVWRIEFHKFKKFSKAIKNFRIRLNGSTLNARGIIPRYLLFQVKSNLLFFASVSVFHKIAAS